MGKKEDAESDPGIEGYRSQEKECRENGKAENESSNHLKQDRKVARPQLRSG
jgi:hypothetical protein